MKRYIIPIALTALAALSLTACHDWRDDYMVEDTVYLRSADDGLIQDFSVYEATNRFGVIKAGKGFSSATVRITVSNTALADFNEANGTKYVPLPTAYYNYDEMVGKEVHFGKDDARVKVDVTWNPGALVTVLSLSKDDYVIPVYIETANLEITESKRLLLIHPVLSTLSVKSDNINVSAKEKTVTAITGKAGVQFDHAISSQDVKVKVKLDNSQAAGLVYNGISYTTAPSGLISLVSDEVTIKAGDTEADIPFNLDMNTVPDGVTYVAGAITIESSSIDIMPIGTKTVIIRIQKTTN